ncbi:MAG: guanylate kinase [Eggerthellaceae bacterium]|nr:guanylate kinase [Eggerthellaceae bacterium]
MIVLENNSRVGNLFVVSGPSGAGKDTLLSQVIERIPDAWVSVSATTRSPRPGEIEGVHYFFLDTDHFKSLVEQDGFLEWAQVHDNYYGTLKQSVIDHMNAGDQVILEIDVQGALQVRKALPEAHLVFIEPPSLEELERRLRQRGTETEDVISSRMKTAEVELAQKMEYDVQVVNNDLERAVDELVEVINSFANDTKGI